MANYPCDPIPHLPPGYTIVEPNDQQRRRGYHVFNGAPLQLYEEWGIVELIPATNPEQFASDAMLIRGYLDTQGHHVHHISRSGMGTALVQFVDVATRDAAMARSPFFMGDSTMRVIKHNRGLNHRNCTFTHDAWVMMMNYPLGAWTVEKVREAVSEFGKLLVWNRDTSNRARIIVKIRVPDILEIPISHVICDSTDDQGHGDSWIVVNYILHSDLIAGPGGNEDPLPPHGANPHPFPALPFGGIWNDEIFAGQDANQNIMNNMPVEEHNDEMEHMVHTPPQELVAHAQQKEQLQSAVTTMDAFCALHELFSQTMKNAATVKEHMDTNTVIAARIQILNVTDEKYSTMKGVMTIITEEKQTSNENSVIITELNDEQLQADYTDISSVQPTGDDMNYIAEKEEISVTSSDTSLPIRHKKLKTAPKDVSEVRRSNRIAIITAGYKDKDAEMQADAKIVDSSSTKEKQAAKAATKKKPISKKTSKSQYTAAVRDHEAPPPPELPMETIQAIGREQCQIPPEEISAEKLLAKV
ncbi:hypothetical protein ACQ4PT_005977 [Festuca glaucescens]